MLEKGVPLKAEWENLIFLGSVFQRVESKDRERALTVRFGIDSCMHSTETHYPQQVVSPKLLTQKDGLCLLVPQDGLKDAQQRLGQLVLQVVLRVDGDVVLQHEDWVLEKKNPTTV